MTTITSQREDFPRWYQDVIAAADLAEGGPARGTIVIKPYGYAIWERIQSVLDEKIKETGHKNAYFPLFIPMSFLEKEARHVEGFSPELAVVTHGGGKELGEPLVVRPTSETVINYMFSKWIQSHRDLPMLVNQWANVVRWELRPRLFLRTTEFLWQEGHTAHATAEEAHEEATRMLGVYRDFIRGHLAIAAITGEKTERERFAGADRTFTVEGLMLDGKALQMGTSHELGQNFAKAFDIVFTDEDGNQRHVWQTSWGVSTRLVGAVIMAHGDDYGLRLPPLVAPIQVIVVPLPSEGHEAMAEAERIAAELASQNIRVEIDRNLHQGFGWRSIEWELKGVPVRVELGPKELQTSSAVLVRRDRREKSRVPLEELTSSVKGLLDEIQTGLFEEHLRFVDEHTRVPKDIDDMARGLESEGGFHVFPYCGSARCEERIQELSASIRCVDPPEFVSAGYGNRISEELSAGERSCLVCGEASSAAAVAARAY